MLKLSKITGVNYLEGTSQCWFYREGFHRTICSTCFAEFRSRLSFIGKKLCGNCVKQKLEKDVETVNEICL